MKVCKMKAVNNQHQLQLREQVHVHDGENSKRLSFKSDEKVYCFLSSSSLLLHVWSTVYLLVIYVQLLKEFQENWHV